MRANNNMCEMLTIKALLMEDEYLIPMYQRNYAWGESHLSQLIQDIWDYYLLEKKIESSNTRKVINYNQ